MLNFHVARPRTRVIGISGLVERAILLGGSDSGAAIMRASTSMYGENRPDGTKNIAPLCSATSRVNPDAEPRLGPTDQASPLGASARPRLRKSAPGFAARPRNAFYDLCGYLPGPQDETQTA